MEMRTRKVAAAEWFRRLHPYAWGALVRALRLEELAMPPRRLIRETIREYEELRSAPDLDEDLDEVEGEEGGDDGEDQEEE